MEGDGERGVVEVEVEERPAAKRARMMAAAQGSRRMLRQIALALLFLVRMSMRTSDTVAASFSQIRHMVRHLDRTLYKYHEMTSRSLAAAFKKHAINPLIEGLRHEMVRLSSPEKLSYMSFLSRNPADVSSELIINTCVYSFRRHACVPIVMLINTPEATKEHASASGSNTNFRLCFFNGLKPPIYTDKNITAEDNAGIKVAMYEGHKVIRSGSLSRARVELLVLRGDLSFNCQDNWTEEEFDKHIVQGRDGQALVLGTARLTNGEVEISRIRFKEGSCRTPSRKFIVAARVCKGEKTNVRVQEAIMEPVTVLDRRNEANEKRHPPKLDDDVYRLEEIAKDGVYHKRLIEAKIYKVGGFLKALNEDEDKLKEILQMKKKTNSWSKLIRHAKECVLGDRQELKRYESKEGNLALLFNYVHGLVGAEFDGDYIACEGFDLSQKALVNKWKGHAYKQLANISFDYVMKGNVPEPISSSIDCIVAAAGPPVLAVRTSEPTFSGNYHAAYQGIGEPENLPGDEHSAGPIYPNADCDPMMTDLGACYYQDQGTSFVDQQQNFQPPVVSGCQQSTQFLMESPYQFEFPGIGYDMFQHTSGASTSAQLNFESGHPPEALQMASADAAARPMMAPAQASFADQEQGTSCPAFPGSGFGNNY
ncbi:hypothetical protein ACP4OV_023258 [Aristida adscensionis]